MVNAIKLFHYLIMTLCTNKPLVGREPTRVKHLLCAPGLTSFIGSDAFDK
jgi:hypothetical protein